MGHQHDDATIGIAVAAARLIAEEGCDYATAKRRAAREVLGSAGDGRGRLPDNATIECELRAYLRTFAGDTQPKILAALRALALRLMQRLNAFHPHLVGAVLNGTATEHSNVVLHLFADSEKDVEIFLLNEGIDFDVGDDDDGGASETLQFIAKPAAIHGLPARVGVVLKVFDANAIRIAPRGRSADPGLHPIEASGRANAAALRQLIDSVAPLSQEPRRL